MSEPTFIIEEVTDADEIARFKAQNEQFERNTDWWQAHMKEFLPQAFGKFVAIAGQEAFLANTPEEAWKWVETKHPEDQGALVHYVRPVVGPRIYANRG